MKRVKIVREFFGIAAAKAQATWQRAKAKKEGRQIHKIEIVPAYELFKTNGWFKNNPFKKIGIPTSEQYIVIVHFEPEIPLVEVKKVLETSAKRVKFSNDLSNTISIVRLPLMIPYFYQQPAKKSFRISCSHFYNARVA